MENIFENVICEKAVIIHKAAYHNGYELPFVFLCYIIIWCPSIYHNSLGRLTGTGTILPISDSEATKANMGK